MLDFENMPKYKVVVRPHEIEEEFADAQELRGAPDTSFRKSENYVKDDDLESWQIPFDDPETSPWGFETSAQVTARLESNGEASLEDLEQHPYEVLRCHYSGTIELDNDSIDLAIMNLNMYQRKKLLSEFFPRVARKEAIAKAKIRKREQEATNKWLLQGGY